ncbi:MAG: OadG family protein [Clostridiaceae bacterium]|nr:OadG family protein [Clostridiaceae bacterium]
MSILMEGLAVTVMGMGTVFAILFLLYLVMVIMGRIFYKGEANKALDTRPVELKQDTASVQSNDQSNDEIDEKELIAVLTAAVAACLNKSTYNLRIKSYRRIGEDSPIWNRVGRKEQLESRII